MTEDFQKKGADFAKFLKELPSDVRDEGNEKSFRNAQHEFERFVDCYSRDECYLCKKPFKSFSAQSPCLHWLLKPKGFKKKHFPAIFEKYGFFQSQSFLRWIANQAGFARNINDLAEEGSGKMFEVTIKFRHIDWAFSCAEGDYEGHISSGVPKHPPHFHFQMRLDGRSFIRYNDFHIPFSEMDLITIEAMKAEPDIVKQRFSFGEGMNDVLTEDAVDEIINAVIPGDASEEAPFKIDTLVMAEEGKSISGEDVYNLIQEAKEKGVTAASLMHKLPNATSQVVVSPGPGVVEQAVRSGRKKDA